jgi:hypothetical protein
MGNFIFSILLEQQQDGLKTSQTKGVWPKYFDGWGSRNKLAHLLSYLNECIR